LVPQVFFGNKPFLLDYLPDGAVAEGAIPGAIRHNDFFLTDI
jgi:hypothetical protein